jgi:hypothetical protein
LGQILGRGARWVAGNGMFHCFSPFYLFLIAAILQNYTPKKAFQALVFLFLLMFVCRLGYGFFYPGSAVEGTEDGFFDGQNWTV